MKFILFCATAPWSQVSPPRATAEVWNGTKQLQLDAATGKHRLAASPPPSPQPLLQRRGDAAQVIQESWER